MNDLKRYYLRANGSTCYDHTGITFPVRQEICLKTLLEQFPVRAVRWAKPFGHTNQPSVLCFTCSPHTVHLIHNKLPDSLIVCHHWLSM